MFNIFKRVLAFCFFICCSFVLQVEGQNASVSDTNRNRKAFTEYLDYVEPYKGLNSKELFVKTAQFFLGKPYVASTLEIGDKEQLVVNLNEFDCTTFVETCLALTLTIKSESINYNSFENNLKKIRYRNGVIDGYTSRLHYMLTWIKDNCAGNLLQNISSQLGGIEKQKQINFMSEHPHLYPKLKDNRLEIERMKQIENSITAADYVIIPYSVILKQENSIQNGDIIIFATAIGGLDYSHLGIAYWVDKDLRMIHASSLYKKVVIEPKTLKHYVNSSRSCTGISVLRLNETPN